MQDRIKELPYDSDPKHLAATHLIYWLENPTPKTSLPELQFAYEKAKEDFSERRTTLNVEPKSKKKFDSLMVDVKGRLASHPMGVPSDELVKMLYGDRIDKLEQRYAMYTDADSFSAEQRYKIATLLLKHATEKLKLTPAKTNPPYKNDLITALNNPTSMASPLTSYVRVIDAASKAAKESDKKSVLTKFGKGSGAAFEKQCNELLKQYVPQVLLEQIRSLSAEEKLTSRPPR